jgi:hypothetical protein
MFIFSVDGLAGIEKAIEGYFRGRIYRSYSASDKEFVEVCKLEGQEGDSEGFE